MPQTAERYLREAAACLRPPPPVAVAIGGLPGSGKSTLARALAPELGGAPGALVLRSDEIRKRLHHVAPEDRLPQAAYSDAASEAVFAALAAAMRARRWRVATRWWRTRPSWTPDSRAKVAEAAAAARRSVRRPVARCAAAGAGRRASRRGERDASDATIAVLHAASRTNPGPGDWVAVDASEAASALAQVRKLLRTQHS